MLGWGGVGWGGGGCVFGGWDLGAGAGCARLGQQSGPACPPGSDVIPSAARDLAGGAESRSLAVLGMTGRLPPSPQPPVPRPPVLPGTLPPTPGPGGQATAGPQARAPPPRGAPPPP